MKPDYKEPNSNEPDVKKPDFKKPDFKIPDLKKPDFYETLILRNWFQPVWTVRTGLEMAEPHAVSPVLSVIMLLSRSRL